jgi:type IV pilus assembly protein PilC
MALYSYKAFSKEGKKTSGIIDAPSLAHVKQELSARGMFPISITPTTQENQQPWWKSLFRRGVKVDEKILFTKQLAVLIKSGVPLLQAIELLIEQFDAPMRGILVTIKDDIQGGQSFADALKKHPRVFENLYIQLVRAGEASGKLDTILVRLIHYLERQEAIRKRIKSALSYPLIQLAVSLLVVVVLLVFVVPTMKENFASQNKKLPAPTEFLISISNSLTAHYLIILIFIIIVVISFKYWKSTVSGARRIDEIKLKIPLVKFFSRTKAIVQFSQTLGLLIESGVNLAEALDIVCNIIDNRILADALNQARDKIIKQGKIAQYLKQTNIFPPIAIYLISTGEETGKLDVMLLTVAQTYEEELGELADSLAAKIGPLLLVVMAVVVGFIVMAMALPMVQMADIAGI